MTTGRMQDDANRPEPPDEAAKTETNKGPRRADMRKYNLGRGGRSRGEYPSGNPRDDLWWRLHEGVGEGALFDEDPEETPSLVTGGGEWAHGGKRSPAWTGSEREQQSDPVGGEGRRRQEMGAMLRRGVLQRSQQSPMRHRSAQQKLDDETPIDWDKFFEKGTQGMWNDRRVSQG